jgi:hypothetical protein
MTTLASVNGLIGIDPQRSTAPVGTASTTVALSGPGEHKVGTPTLVEGNKTAVYAYVPSTYGTITAGTRFDLTSTFETTVNASGRYVTPASTDVPAGKYFWAFEYTSPL